MLTVKDFSAYDTSMVNRVTREQTAKAQSGKTKTMLLPRAWRLAVLRASNHTRVIPEILNSFQEKIENKYRRNQQLREFEIKQS